MGVQFEDKGKHTVVVRYANSPVPYTVEENFVGNYYDHGDFLLAEVLQDQESVYQSFQRTQNDGDELSSNYGSQSDTGLGESRIQHNSLTSVKSQLSMDEALARELQEMEHQLANNSLNHDLGKEESSSRNGEPNCTNSSVQVPRQDDIDLDNMTYEELQSLGEAIGSESRGLSEELISFLPTATYKTGFFSKKEKHDECVICYLAYRNRDKLIVLPCHHQYHSVCLTRWLKINKACPVCNEEVFGS